MSSPFGGSTYSYEEKSGRLQSITTSGGASVAYRWDGPWLEEVTVGGPFEASIQLEPDRPQPGQPLTNFWIARLTLNAQPSTEIELEYDDDGLATRIGELDLFHDATTGLLLGGHVLDTGTRVARNGFGELTELVHGFHGAPYTSGGQPPFVGHRLLDMSYDRDAIGRIERKTEDSRTALGAALDTHVFEYEYEEGSGRLLEVERDGVVVESYAYDPNGNRTSWTRGAESGTATYDSQDRLLTYGPQSFTYTPNGELRTRTQAGQTVTYTYDTFSNLRAVRLPDGIQIEYLIDGSNRRIGKKINGTLVQRFLYLGGLSPIAEVDASGAVTTQYVYGNRINVPDYFVRAGTTYRILTDHLGSVRAVVDAETGAIAQRMEYDSYGRVTLDTNPGFQPFGFAGGLWDPQTGLVRFGARDYDPETGRWTTKDPIGFAGGDLNLYGYVLGDPVNAFDPSGLSWIDELRSSAQNALGLALLFAGATKSPLVDPDHPTAVNILFDEALASVSPEHELGLQFATVLGGRSGPPRVPSGTAGANHLVDLTTPSRRRHLLDGDATGGGHRPGAAIPGKSEFPAGWSDERIIHAISDVATDPAALRTAGRGGRTVVTGARDGVEVRVVLEADGTIVTGFPTNVPRIPSAVLVTRDFEKTERFLDAILADLSGILSSAEREEVIEFINVGEYGVALETLTALIVEEGKRITLPTFERIVELAASLNLRETIPAAALRCQVDAQ